MPNLLVCKNCTRSFQSPPSDRAKFCGQTCYWQDMRTRRDEQTSNWKGNQVGYGALHQWVYRHLGKADKCTMCGSKKNIQWANKSQEYRRDLTDWLKLCRSCHFAYDDNPLAKIGAKKLERNTYAKDNPTYYNRWTHQWERRQNFAEPA